MTLEDYLLQQTKEDLIEIYREAMDLMQQYNGRSYTWCVVTACGGMTDEQEDGTYIYTLPTTSDYSILISRVTTVDVVATSLKEAFEAVREMYEGGDACAELGDANYTEL